MADPAKEPRGIVLPPDGLVEGMWTEPGDVPWLAMPLKARQERAFLGAGLRPGDDDPSRERVFVAADVALTPAAARWILALGRTRKEVVTIRPTGELGKLVDACTFGRTASLAGYAPPGSPLDPEQIACAPVLDLDPKERPLDLPVPRSQFGVDSLRLPLAERLIFPCGHWLQVLWANLLGLAPFLWVELTGSNLATIVWRLTWASLRARSTDPTRVGAVLRRRGRGCRVHPSAVVEGSWLGEGVQIGAQAVVRGCVLGDGARVEDAAIVEFSTLGAGSMVQRQAICKFSVLAPRAACAGAMQMGVLAREASLKYGATLLDMNPGQGVRVRAKGQFHPAPFGIAGSCVGPRTLVGNGVRVAPGRVVPGDLVVLPPPKTILYAIPETVEAGTWVVEDGRLVWP